MQNILEVFITGVILGNTVCTFSSCTMSPILCIASSGGDVKSSVRSLSIFSVFRLATYVFLGAAAGIAGIELSRAFRSDMYNMLIGIITGSVILLTGFFIILGIKAPSVFCRLRKTFKLGTGSRNFAFMGVLMALVPCAPFTSLITQVILGQGGIPAGALKGLIFGVGTTINIPLWVFGIFSNTVSRKLLTENRFYMAFKIVCGILLGVIGIRYILGTI